MNPEVTNTPKLIIICGLSFSGKTTLGTEIAKQLGYEQVDVDDTKVRLLGLKFSDNDLDQAAWIRIYKETDKLIEEYLQSGKSVVDASRSFKKKERELARQIAEKNHVLLQTVYVDTPVNVAKERFLANKQNPTRVDWGDDSFNKIVSIMEPPTQDENPLIFHYADNISDWITKNKNIL